MLAKPFVNYWSAGFLFCTSGDETNWRPGMAGGRSIGRSVSGERSQIHVNVRIIAATNRRLEEAVASGTFPPDLFYRLDVFRI